MKIPRRFSGYCYGIIQSGITTSVAAAVATHRAAGFNSDAILLWLHNWLQAWLLMLPVVVGISPLIQRLVDRFVSPD